MPSYRQHHVTKTASGNPLYQTWLDIRRRCYNQKDKDYKNYGGRGITVYKLWRDSSRCFIDDIERLIGPRQKGLTLDRIDNDGPYAPWNVRWADHATQRVNRKRGERQWQQEDRF